MEHKEETKDTTKVQEEDSIEAKALNLVAQVDIKAPHQIT